MFYRYHGSVSITSPSSAFGCIIRATNEASEHIGHRHEGDQPMGAHLRRWPNLDSSVFLTLVPGEEMTWNVLGTLLFAIRLFVRDNAFEFELWTEGVEGEVGFGQLTGDGIVRK